jgi:hypothetical protein
VNQHFSSLEELGEQFRRVAEAAETSGRADSTSSISARLRSGGRRFWSVVGASAVALVAGAVVAVVLLTAGTQAAYAGWSAVPTTANPSALEVATHKCYGTDSGASPLGQPVLSEARSVSTAAVYVVADSVYMCLYDSALPALANRSLGPLRSPPGPDQLGTPYGVAGGGGRAKLPRKLFQTLKGGPRTRAAMLALRDFDAGDGYGFWAVGQAGSDVSGVTFGFAGGKTVVATLQNGWYFAWWPWTTEPTSATVTTSSGAVTSPMGASPHDGLGQRPYPACEPGSSGCVFVKTAPAPASTPPATGQVPVAAQDCTAATLSDGTAPAGAFETPVLTQVHGIFTALISVANGRLYACLTGGDQQDVHAFFAMHVGAYGRVGTTPAPGQLSAPYTSQDGFGSGRDGPGLHGAPHRPLTRTEARSLMQRLSGGGYGPYVIGQAGSGVSAVTVAFANGQTVAATIANGWYFAWWPWLSAPTSVTVTSASGTSASPVNDSNAPRQNVTPGCTPGSSGCVFSSSSTERSGTGTSPSTTTTAG